MEPVHEVSGRWSRQGSTPERAVRAALAIRARFGAFAGRVATAHGGAVGIRLGVETGEVVAGRDAVSRGELMVTGDVVNVAARLQQLAAPGEILVGERAHAATQRAIGYGGRRLLDAKGKSEPVPAWDAQVAGAGGGREARRAVRRPGRRARAPPARREPCRP